MLTKKERAVIAARLKIYSKHNPYDLYRAITGKGMPEETTGAENNRNMLRAILDLCDTSNMVELPLDKDGEVIHIRDVVYDNSGMEWEVSNIRFHINGADIVACSDDDYFMFRPDEFTHKKPVTIASITERIREIASNDDDISYCTSSELVRIAEQLESLGDAND